MEGDGGEEFPKGFLLVVAALGFHCCGVLWKNLGSTRFPDSSRVLQLGPCTLSTSAFLLCLSQLNCFW